MQRQSFLSLLLFIAAGAFSSEAALVWQAGRDDNGWPLTGTSGGPEANFVQENGSINFLPGSPDSTPTVAGADNDYYFSGVYTTTIPSVETLYGAYSPVGLVASDENSAERALAGADNDLRFHFNLSNTLPQTDLLSVTFDAFNLDTGNGSDPRYGVEVYFNGVLVMPQVIIRPAEIDRDFTTPLFSQASVNAVRGPGADNVVSLVGINYSGTAGGNWMGIDFVQLNSEPIPEPSSALMIFSGAVGIAPLLRRWRN